MDPDDKTLVCIHCDKTEKEVDLEKCPICFKTYCDECGYQADALSRNQLGPRVRALAGAWRETLGRGSAVTRLREGDDRTWTPLEYGCHVRDVFKIFEERTRQMLKKRKVKLTTV